MKIAKEYIESVPYLISESGFADQPAIPKPCEEFASDKYGYVGEC